MSYRQAMLRSLYKWRNCSYLSHADKDMQGRIVTLSREHRYAQVFISHSLLGSCIDIVRRELPEAVIITDAHNFESSLSAQLVKKAGTRQALLQAKCGLDQTG